MHYRKLRACQVAHELAREVAQATRDFPYYERFELTSQLRRAVLSAPTNLVEGQARFGAKEALRFSRIAAASLAEVEYLLSRAFELGYLPDGEYQRLERLRTHASRVVYRLIRGLDAAR